MKYQIDGFYPVAYFNCDPVYVFINAKTKLQQLLNADIVELRNDLDVYDTVTMIKTRESLLQQVNQCKTFEELKKLFDIYPIEE